MGMGYGVVNHSTVFQALRLSVARDLEEDPETALFSYQKIFYSTHYIEFWTHIWSIKCS